MQEISARPIVTHYYLSKAVVKTNRALYSNSAVLNCINHMQLNHYGADVAEVFDEFSGVLHAVITMSKIGKIEIVFKRKIVEGM